MVDSYPEKKHFSEVHFELYILPNFPFICFHVPLKRTGAGWGAGTTKQTKCPLTFCTVKYLLKDLLRKLLELLLKSICLD